MKYILILISAILMLIKLVKRTCVKGIQIFLLVYCFINTATFIPVLSKFEYRAELSRSCKFWRTHSNILFSRNNWFTQVELAEVKNLRRFLSQNFSDRKRSRRNVLFCSLQSEHVRFNPRQRI